MPSVNSLFHLNFRIGDSSDVYLTFDDGPHPKITPWVLEQLNSYNHKGTFFLVGENAKKYPDVVKLILDSGHAIGNHTLTHLSGWKTESRKYIKNINTASKYIDSSLFRPPYGRIRPAQIKSIKDHYRIIMWDVLSKDYDPKITQETCLKRTIQGTKKGSIIVFHDSEKAFRNLEYVLPKYLEYLNNNRIRSSIIDSRFLG